MLTYEILSKKGERDYNEDYAGAEQHGDSFCFVLADGLGGHGGGAEASEMVAEAILKDFKQWGEVSEAYLKKCFEKSQKLLLAEQERQNRQNEMKTTLIVLLTDQKTLQWGHIGDSRLYLFHKKRLKQHTLDHSVPQMLAAAGEIKEDEIRHHPDRNRLLRVMGTEWDSPRYQLSERIVCKGKESILMCSDGFWEWVLDKTMLKTLKRAKSPAEWCCLMEQEALKNGTGKKMDNYSAITVFF